MYSKAVVTKKYVHSFACQSDQSVDQCEKTSLHEVMDYLFNTRNTIVNCMEHNLYYSLNKFLIVFLETASAHIDSDKVPGSFFILFPSCIDEHHHSLTWYSVPCTARCRRLWDRGLE